MKSHEAACHVLVVDDDRMQNEILSVFLERLEFEFIIDCALTIDDAIKSIFARKPDIVFLDNRIPPDIDCRDALKRIRRAGYDGAVIVLSVATDDPVLLDVGALGVKCVVDKFDLREDLLRELVVANWSGVPRIPHKRTLN